MQLQQRKQQQQPTPPCDLVWCIGTVTIAGPLVRIMFYTVD